MIIALLIFYFVVTGIVNVVFLYDDSFNLWQNGLSFITGWLLVPVYMIAKYLGENAQ